MRPEDWVRVAENLLDAADPSEAHRRSASHACYYAVYHFAARHFGLDPSAPNAGHAEVGNRLKTMRFQDGLPRAVVMARRVFGELKDLRVHADYYLGRPFTDDDADRALQLAQMVVGSPPLSR
ncbi:hypothetical protein [Azospirillum sp.]|uniref:hypothetical protein n=1 Tax=Azospirillum sp. TaxID=34012 RepID=UPI002D5F404B|nr:hypothetical protein [Azospirillum sp.]HYD64194.1 hypothetical protein [Azospirillum sp.]